MLQNAGSIIIYKIFHSSENSIFEIECECEDLSMQLKRILYLCKYFDVELFIVKFSCQIEAIKNIHRATA